MHKMKVKETGVREKQQKSTLFAHFFFYRQMNECIHNAKVLVMTKTNYNFLSCRFQLIQFDSNKYIRIDIPSHDDCSTRRLLCCDARLPEP